MKGSEHISVCLRKVRTPRLDVKGDDGFSSGLGLAGLHRYIVFACLFLMGGHSGGLLRCLIRSARIQIARFWSALGLPRSSDELMLTRLSVLIIGNAITSDSEVLLYIGNHLNPVALNACTTLLSRRIVRVICDLMHT